MIKISPSILASDFSNLSSELNSIYNAGAQYAHIDVMDGKFVPNITLGPCVISSARKNSPLIFDTHLMIDDPIRYISEFAQAGSDIITFHYESCTNHIDVIKKIVSCGKKVGIAIKPETSPSLLKPFLSMVDMILVMTVEPGFGGQSFIPETVENIKAVKNMLAEAKLDEKVDIEVDGGITPANVGLVKAAGANVIVAGSAVFKSDDRKIAIDALKTNN